MAESEVDECFSFVVNGQLLSRWLSRYIPPAVNSFDGWCLSNGLSVSSE